jgi:hypothetical protein
MTVPTSAQATTQGWTATATLPVPAGSQGPGPHVLAVLVRSMSHQEDGGANNAFKTALGLTAVTFGGAAPPVTWRIQGNQGGEQIADPVRGPLNAGGLYGERSGWHLPGYPDHGWDAVSLPNADRGGAGVRGPLPGLPRGLGAPPAGRAAAASAFPLSRPRTFE